MHPKGIKPLRGAEGDYVAARIEILNTLLLKGVEPILGWGRDIGKQFLVCQVRKATDWMS